METARPAFERVLLKLSGEALMGDLDYGIDPAYIRRLAGEVKAVSCLLYTSPSPRDRQKSRMPSSA